MDLGLRGAAVIVNGGSQGMGRAAAEAMAGEGARVAVRSVRAALPLLRKAAWARIVNVSAHSTRRQSPDIVAYTAAKSALTSLSKNPSSGHASTPT